MKETFYITLLSLWLLQQASAQQIIEGISPYTDLQIPKKENSTVVPLAKSTWHFEWKTPDIRSQSISESRPLVLNDNSLGIQLRIESPVEIGKADCSLLINGAAPKTDVVNLRPPTQQGNTYYHDYANVLNMEGYAAGKYKVEVLVNKNGEKYLSEPLWVQYSPEKIKLFVLSIGVPSNLKYTSNDAKDFANAFSKHELYKETTFSFFNTAESTTASKIRTELARLANLYKNGTINPRDMIVMFISSHGNVLDGNNFCIQGSDFDAADMAETSVTFQQINERLKDVNCKKVLFIDACHSGTNNASDLMAMKATNNAVQKALAELRQQKDSWSIITSSNTEVSWEHANWQNGSFTEAILEAFKSSSADSNKNGILSLQEIFDYISKRCPALNISVGFPAQYPQFKRADDANLEFYLLKP